MLPRRKHSVTGFTLLEMVIVLSIISIFGLWAINMPNPISKLSVNLYLSQFKKDLYMCQQVAISERVPYRIYITNSEGAYEIRRTSLEPPLLIRQGVKGMSLSFSTVTSVILVNSNGAFNNAGTIIYHTSSEMYELCFLIGEGRFYVAKI